MKAWKAVVLAVLSAGLTACVTTASHTLSVDEVRALRLERLDLVLDSAARVHWSAAEEEYAKSKGGRPQGDSAAPREAPTEGFRAYIAGRLRDKAKAVIEPSLRSALVGTRPVAARINVHGVNVTGFFEGMVPGILLGPQAVTSDMGVSVDIVDARTGAPVLSYPRTALSTQGGQKLDWGFSGAYSSDPIERLLADLNGRLTPWLLKT